MAKSKHTLTAFGKAVKRKAISKNMTLTEIAEEAGTNPKYLNFIIYGRRSGKKYRSKIAEILGIDLDKYTA